jgi:8-amino-7-oxononanoate synthase
MNSLEHYFAQELQQRKAQGILRKLKLSDSSLKDFTSNDYLGLARNQVLQNIILDRVKGNKINIGATGSRLLSGNSIYHHELEEQLKGIFKGEACLLFNSGYSANTGVMSAIPSRHDTILYDELCHASLKDGIRLSLATKHPFKHNDLNDLEQKVKKSQGKIFIVVESIYSMDGDLCPLAELVQLAARHESFIILDEAHSTGVLGQNGSGLAVSLNLHDKIPIRIYTFGKAIGVHGACVVGSKNLIDYLVNFSRPFIYTTALPEHTLISIAESFRFLKINSDLQHDLQTKIQTFKKVLDPKFSTSPTAIQTIVLNSIGATRTKSEALVSKGFDIRPILSPTVPKGKERLRICLHTFNSNEDINNLACELNYE